jgi:ABC-type branched-subunit amino acid transport system ATPase component
VDNAAAVAPYHPGSMPLLTVSNVHHAYGTQIVLDGATCAIEPGEKVGLVGRNGQDNGCHLATARC